MAPSITLNHMPPWLITPGLHSPRGAWGRMAVFSWLKMDWVVIVAPSSCMGRFTDLLLLTTLAPLAALAVLALFSILFQLLQVLDTARTAVAVSSALRSAHMPAWRHGHPPASRVRRARGSHSPAMSPASPSSQTSGAACALVDARVDAACAAERPKLLSRPAVGGLLSPLVPPVPLALRPPSLRRWRCDHSSCSTTP